MEVGDNGLAQVVDHVLAQLQGQALAEVEEEVGGEGQHQKAADAPLQRRPVVGEAAVAELAEHARDGCRLAGAEEHGRAGLAAEELELRLGEELDDRRMWFSVLPVDDVSQPACSPLLGELLQFRQIAARVGSRRAQEANARRLREDAELGAASDLGRVLDLEPEAQIGLVASVATHGLAPVHALEGQLELDSEALAPDCLDHLFHQ